MNNLFKQIKYLIENQEVDWSDPSIPSSNLKNKAKEYLDTYSLLHARRDNYSTPKENYLTDINDLHTKSKNVLDNIAKNPNTDVETLVKLMNGPIIHYSIDNKPKISHYDANNPVWDLHSLDDPTLKMDYDRFRDTLLNKENVSNNLNRPLKNVILNNSDSSMGGHFKDFTHVLKKSLEKPGVWSSDELKHMLEKALSTPIDQSSDYDRYSVKNFGSELKNKRFNKELIDHAINVIQSKFDSKYGLPDNPFTHYLSGLEENPNATKDQIDKIIDLSYAHQDLVTDKKIDPDTLHDLVLNHNSSAVKKLGIWNPNLSKETFINYFNKNKDDSEALRTALMNTNINKWFNQDPEFFNSMDSNTILHLFQNKKPLDNVHVFQHHPNTVVRHGVITHSNVRPDILEKMSQEDPDPENRLLANETLKRRWGYE